MAKTEEEIVNTAMSDWNKKHTSDEAWLKSRVQGAWRSGFANAKAEDEEKIQTVKEEAYNRGKNDMFLTLTGWKPDDAAKTFKAYHDLGFEAGKKEKGAEEYQRGLDDGYKKCLSENDFDQPCVSCDRYQIGYNVGFEAGKKEKNAEEYKRGYDAGVKDGADLAAMHGSDATSQQLEKAFFDGVEEAMKKNDQYQLGLNHAWEAAKKISLLHPDEVDKIFPGAAKYNRFNLGYNGTEVIEKLREWEEKQPENEINIEKKVVEKFMYDHGICNVDLNEPVKGSIVVDMFNDLANEVPQVAELLKAMEAE